MTFLNNEVGAIIRSEQIGSVNPLTVPFVAGSTLPALQYLDMLVEEKTGISKMSMGVNADMLAEYISYCCCTYCTSWCWAGRGNGEKPC